METETIGKGRSPMVLAISTIAIIVIIVAGLFVYIFVDKKDSKIVLLTFLVCVIIIGICMIIFVEYQRRKAQKRKDMGANCWVEETYEAQSRPRPTAPPMSERSSWALLPRKWSTATALPAYSPPQH